MQRIVSKLSAVATVLLLGSAALVGVAWLRASIPGAAKPDPPFPPPGKIAPIELASIPWKRNPAHPIEVHEPLAIGGLAWPASVDRPRKVYLTAAAVPWTSVAPMPLDLAAGAVPWSSRTPADGQAVAIQPAILPWPIDKK